MADRFTASKLEWLDRVAADPRIGHLAFRVAYILASAFLSRASGDAWPSQAALAEAVHVDRRSVQRGVDELVGAGHLDVTVNRGRAGVNRYRPRINAASVSHKPTGENATPTPHKGASDNATEAPHKDFSENAAPVSQYSGDASDLMRQNPQFNAAPVSHDMRHPRRTNPLIEPIEEPKEREARKRASTRGSRLPADWQPSSADREFARGQRLTEDQIDLQADRFRDYWRGQSGHRALKLDWPATWRNWVRPRDANTQRPGQRPSAFEQSLEYLRDVQEGSR